MINGVTTRVNIDTYIMNAIREDITSEDVTTNAIMPEPRQGKADLICKEDGIIYGLEVFKRTFELLDTRKTTPNMRPFEKYAVKVGGGTNHRYNLSDGVLIKDNHIGAAGSITKAVAMAKEYAPFVRKIEVEVESLEQLDEALAAGADIIMLDNMDNDTMREAVRRVAGKAETECSGNVTAERLAEIAEIGVDYVSSGALTHSAPIMDISLKNLVPTE